MAPKKDDSPSIIVRLEQGRLVPAGAIDAETIAGLRDGTELSVTILKTPPSVALRAWWALLGDVVKHTDDWPNARALSNAILLACNCYDEEKLFYGDTRRTPMSLKDFSEDQLWELVEYAKMIVVREIIPGVDLDELKKNSRRT